MVTLLSSCLTNIFRSLGARDLRNPLPFRLVYLKGPTPVIGVDFYVHGYERCSTLPRIGRQGSMIEFDLKANDAESLLRHRANLR